MKNFRTRKNQQGVAVITALLLTTLAVTLVASLFWQQQVQVRSIENQRLQLQKQWILRGSMDWASLILREDAKKSSVDYIGEPWSVPLAETHLDDYVDEKSSNDNTGDVVLSGSINDAQARYNLTNLASNGVINPVEVNTLRRLLANLKLNPSLAQIIADRIAATQTKMIDSSSAQSQTSNPNSSAVHQIGIEQNEDLLSVPGFTIETFKKIKDFVIVLPHPTPVNVNTAPVEVLAASVDALSMSDAAQLVASRDHAYFKDPGDFNARLSGKILAANNIATYSNFFLANGNVRINHASLKKQALIERNFMIGNRIIWMREI